LQAATRIALGVGGTLLGATAAGTWGTALLAPRVGVLRFLPVPVGIPTFAAGGGFESLQSLVTTVPSGSAVVYGEWLAAHEVVPIMAAEYSTALLAAMM